MQIDDLLVKLDNATADLDRLRDEKDQEIAIMQEGMDATIQQLSEAQQVKITLNDHASLAIHTVFLEPRPE